MKPMKKTLALFFITVGLALSSLVFAACDLEGPWQQVTETYNWPNGGTYTVTYAVDPCGNSHFVGMSAVE